MLEAWLWVLSSCYVRHARQPLCELSSAHINLGNAAFADPKLVASRKRTGV